MPTLHSFPISVPAESDAEAMRKVSALKTLGEHISAENLALLAKKAKDLGSEGINKKFKQYAAFL